MSTPFIIFSITNLNKMVREVLEKEIEQVWLTGEMSNFSHPASGHWYFTLKDNHAQVRCAMFRNSNRNNTRPYNGQQVIVHALLTLYEARGDYQLIIDIIKPVGDGLLQKKFEELKQKLSQEGLFDQKFKKSLPNPTNCVGIITSLSGAALHDILQILKRRDILLPIVIYHTTVQGQEAPHQIIRALELANYRSECDVIILSRGGGSLEDLNPFNNEKVARAIFASRIPIISAIGHETDITIADFVADLRASTPSAAAELVSRDQLEVLRQFQSQQHRLEMAMDYLLAQYQQNLNHLLHKFKQKYSKLSISQQQIKLIKIYQYLKCYAQNRLIKAQHCQEKLCQYLLKQSPAEYINFVQQQLQSFNYRLNQLITYKLNKQQNKHITLCSQLESMSPLKILSRGFSITINTHGTIIKNTQQVIPGDRIYTRLKDGFVESKVVCVNQQHQ